MDTETAHTQPTTNRHTRYVLSVIVFIIVAVMGIFYAHRVPFVPFDFLSFSVSNVFTWFFVLVVFWWGVTSYYLDMCIRCASRYKKKYHVSVTLSVWLATLLLAWPVFFMMLNVYIRVGFYLG